MKIVFIYRSKKTSAYSIEGIFSNIAKELTLMGESVFEYELNPSISIIKHIFWLKRINADIYHITGDINYISIFLPAKKTILTIHDLGHFLFSLKGLRRYIYKLFWLTFPIQRVSTLTCVSDATKLSLCRHINTKNKQINVIRNCVNPDFSYVHKGFNAERPIVLQVGTSEHKNIRRLIQALSGLTCKLVIVGMLSKEINELLKKHEIIYENYVSLSQQEIMRKYSECHIVSFISLFEGFGMPIIEAQASGKPLITSNFPPMTDIAGDAALFVNPYSIESIREGFVRLFSDKSLRNNLVPLGIGNAKKYSVKIITSQYLDLYKKMLKKM